MVIENLDGHSERTTNVVEKRFDARAVETYFICRQVLTSGQGFCRVGKLTKYERA
jgi:hypothetical protein